MKLSKVAISTGMIATLLFANMGVTHADTAKKSVHNVALEVINGNYGNGEERVSKLKNAGYDSKAVQDEVNKILLDDETVVEAPANEASVSSTSKAAIEKQPTQSEATPKASVAGLDMNQTTGQVNIAALANYMVNNTANTAGYTADEWAYIISRESNGLADVANPSSGAYGAFQLLGHGEYAGMTLAQQADMASKLPAGSWVVYN